MEPVLPLDEVDFDHSVEQTGNIDNMSAEEYLSWVRYQANALPAVVRATIDQTKTSYRQSKYMPEIEDIAPCPIEYQPTEEWQREILYAFSELRTNIYQLSLSESSRERKIIVPALKNGRAWQLFCFGEIDNDIYDEHEENGDNVDDEIMDEDDSPFKAGVPQNNSKNNKNNSNNVNINNSADLEELISKKKRDLSNALELSDNHDSNIIDAKRIDNGSRIIFTSKEDDNNDNIYDNNNDVTVSQPQSQTWDGAQNVAPAISVLLQFDQVLTQKLFAFHVEWMELRNISSARGKWIYGLLARIEKPVCQATVALIRQLYRRCCSLRYSLTMDHTDNIDFDTDLAMLNMLISITGSYFGQGSEEFLYDEQ
eukprot:gene12487-16753_t